MSNENLKQRTKKFALDVIKLVETLPNDRTSHVLGGQLLRAGTSVGANYRAACRARSAADFISKIGIVEEEADESSYWIELLVDAGKLEADKSGPLLDESGELVAISVGSINTARRNNARKSAKPSANRIPHSALRTPH
ncbi:MAG: four helix bundle protein [Verrucomicrobia bacterium]|nr:MAG: four helix bundle protein [Verrucomicrobiota bacterium]PYJ95814.1 MAG: four helix bundle protein [Verrucomicrobiota bacterium]